MNTREQTQAYYDKHASQYDKRTGFAGNTGQAYNFTRYFAPFLDLPNNYGGTFRLQPHVIARIEASRPPVDPYPYVSPVGLFPRHSIWLRPTKAELWVVATVLAALCLGLPTWTGRSGRASPRGIR